MSSDSSIRCYSWPSARTVDNLDGRFLWEIEWLSRRELGSGLFRLLSGTFTGCSDWDFGGISGTFSKTSNRPSTGRTSHWRDSARLLVASDLPCAAAWSYIKCIFLLSKLIRIECSLDLFWAMEAWVGLFLAYLDLLSFVEKRRA